MSDNSGMWTAVTVCAVIYAYSMLKDDLKSVGDKGKEVIKDVADALNPTKDTNLAYRGAGAIFGEDVLIDKVGGGIARILGTDSLAKQQSTPKPPKKVEAGLPAKQFNGKWLKLAGGKWIGLTKSDKVFSVSGKYVVHHYLWKPS